MSLTVTTARLEAAWALDQRRNPPWQRWADTDPALDLPPATIRHRLDQRDRAISGTILAALVRLAKNGDPQAAQLVTLTLLPRMVRAEQRRPHDDSYDELAGLLWEAIVTVHNTEITCLRETIERNAWRRKRQLDRTLRAVPLNDSTHIDTRRDIPPAAADHIALRADLRRLHAAGGITARTLRVLEQISTDTEPVLGGPTYEAARKQRWRTLAKLRAVPGLRETLIA